MEAEIPAEGIMKKGDYCDGKLYEISCECGQTDHYQLMEVEADEFGISVNILTKQTTNCWSEPFKPEYTGKNEFLYKITRTFKNCVNGLFRRVSLTWSIWARGYVQYEVTTVMNKQQALNYAETLKKAITDVEHFRNQRKQPDSK